MVYANEHFHLEKTFAKLLKKLPSKPQQQGTLRKLKTNSKRNPAEPSSKPQLSPVLSNAHTHDRKTTGSVRMNFENVPRPITRFLPEF